MRPVISLAINGLGAITLIVVRVIIVHRLITSFPLLLHHIMRIILIHLPRP